MAPRKSRSSSPILTKISPSARTDRHILREALTARLDQVLGRRLTLIRAPAGYGKTSLLAQWYQRLLQREVRVAWLTLDEEEFDVSLFAEYLVAAIGAELVSESLPPKAALSAIVNWLSRSERQTVLILDDFHRASSESVCALVRNLIRLAPATLHVVIASRDHPSVGQSVLTADDELLELGVEDLRFTMTEARLLLHGEPAVTLTDPELRKLVDRTEGWPIALQMTALSLRRGCDRAELIARFTGPAWELASYLSEQVLASLPADIERVITRTAVVEQLDGELVNLLCGRTDGALVLERLEQQNLFLVPLDPQHRTYRYHQLFAEILRDRLARRDPETFRSLHRQAAVWYCARGKPSQAVSHAVLAGDERLIAEILDEAGGWRLIPEGRMDILVAGLDRLTEATIQQFPRLQLARVYLLVKKGQVGAARAGFDEFCRTRDRATLPAGLWTEVKLVGEMLSGYEDTPITLDDLLAKESLIRSLPGSDHLMLADVCESLGEGYCDCGWLERALEPTRQARAHLHALGSPYGEMFTCFQEARIKLAQGRLEEAQATLEETWSDIERHFGPKSDLAAICAVYLAEIHYERNAADKAAALLAWALPHVEDADGWLEFYAAGFGTAIRTASGRSPEEARAMIGRMRSLARRRQLRPLEVLAGIHDIELLLQQGRHADAQLAAQAAGLAELAACMREDNVVNRTTALAASVCQARLYLALGDPASALAELARTERWARRHGHGRLLITLSILASHAHRTGGQVDRAVARFDEAVDMAMFQDFLGPFVDSRQFIAQAALFEPRVPAPGKSDRFRENFLRRLRKTLERHAGPTRERDALSDPEILTLQHLNRGFTNKEIARLLAVSPNTVKYRLKSLYEKLGVSTRKDAVRLARERRLTDALP